MSTFGSESYESEFLSTPRGTPIPASLTHPNVSSFSDRIILPEGFMDWLLKLTPTARDDPHLVKNFIELCFNASHLNSTRLGEIMEHGGFLRLTWQLTEQFMDDSKKKYTKTMVSIALNLCLELSQELVETFVPDAVNVALCFLRIPDFITGGTEMLLNCFLFAIHENFKITEDSRDILVACKQSCIRIPREVLLQTFYSEEPKFGNYIPKFTKLCSLPPFKSLAVEIVSHPHFIKKVETLFDVYRSSLIIQIDFLKFLKMVLTRYTEYMPSSTNKNIPTNILIASAMKQRFIDPTSTVVTDVAIFLNNNWRPENSMQGQVGADSILVKQLCSDIERIQVSRPTTSDKRVDRHGFVVPR